MPAQPRERVIVTYRGRNERTLNIIIKNLHQAQEGVRNMQQYIAHQYFKSGGSRQVPVNWDWSCFSFTRTGEVGDPPKPRAKKMQLRVYGCTCPMDCAACDQEHHSSCRYGCKYGHRT